MEKTLAAGPEEFVDRTVDSPDVSIVIVNWNTCNDLRNCLRSLYQLVSNRTSFEIVVVDNASSDESIEVVRKEFPRVICLQNFSNLGFSAANNQGIHQSQGRFVLLLNPDCIFFSDCLSPLIEKMERDETIGMAGCRLLNADGTLQKSVDLFPSPFHEVAPWFQVKRNRFLKLVDAAVISKSDCEVGVVIGAFQLVRRSLLNDVGRLDNGLFMYGEDLDLCYRIKRAGKKIVYCPSETVVHLGGKSSDQVWTDAARLFRVRQSIFLVQRKHFGQFRAAASLVLRTAVSWLRFALAALTFRPANVRSLYAADAAANSRTLTDLGQIVKSYQADRTK